MARNNIAPLFMSFHFFLIILFASFLILLPTTRAAEDDISQQYCSSQNTGLPSYNYNSSQGAWWQYQSLGWCHDHCGSDYAFAVLQGYSCWCSNYVPSDQQDVGDCSGECPGYPSESCGSESDDLYGYVALSASPSGTMAASSAAASSTDSPTSDSQSSSSDSSWHHSTAWTTTTSNDPQSTMTSSPTTAAASSSPASTTDKPTAVTSLQVITVSGAVVTQTIVSPSSPDSMSAKQTGLSGGAIAGIIVGTVVGIALLAACFFWAFFARRRKQSRDGMLDDDVNGSSGVTQTRSPRRTTSVLSRIGLLDKTRYSGFQQSSSHDTSDDPSSPVSERRQSRPFVYDQRMNPNLSQLLAGDNSSRQSIRTMDDNRDYSRTLGIRNPDPEPHSFEIER